MTEADIRRTAFLHEAGHAIVALESGLVVKSVYCDGEHGSCDADLAPELNARLDQARAAERAGTISKNQFLDKVIDIYAGRFATLVGGIAGESLVNSPAIFATRRASDDLVNFFGTFESVSRHLRANQFTPIWRRVFIEAQDSAWQIVRRRKADIHKLADALEARQRLSGEDIRNLLAS